MQVTGPLKVYRGDEPAGDSLRIHPNDGFDLGLMTNAYEMKIFNNCSAEEFNVGAQGFFQGLIEQSNDCPPGTVQVSYKTDNKLNLPEAVKLVRMNDKLLLLHLAT